MKTEERLFTRPDIDVGHFWLSHRHVPWFVLVSQQFLEPFRWCANHCHGVTMSTMNIKLVFQRIYHSIIKSREVGLFPEGLLQEDSVRVLSELLEFVIMESPDVDEGDLVVNPVFRGDV